MESKWYVEYSRDDSNPKVVTDKAVFTDKNYKRLQKINWVNIIKASELKDDESIKAAKGKEWSKYSDIGGVTISESYEDVPMTVGAVGYNCPTRWLYSVYDRFLNVYNISSGVNLVFNTFSADDVKRKLEILYDLRDNNKCNPDDISELEERLRTMCNFEIASRRPPTMAGISEAGKVVTVYRDGKPVQVVKRGKSKVVTDAQRDAAANARQYAHTDEANKKRRKSISARSDGKILGEI